MKPKFIAALLAVLMGGFFVCGASAQTTSPEVLPNGCGTGNATNSLSYLTVDSTLKLCVNATVSASITGFPGSSQTTGTPIAVTSSGVTGTLPAGTVVVASNVGATNGAYCKLGASASTSDQLIPPNSWFGFTVGTNTQLSCITSSSTTTVNMVGGSGLPTGSGGGGGGTGGGGAITAASGSYAAGALSAGAGVDGWDLTQGTTTQGACAGDNTSGCSVEARLQRIAQNLTTLNTTAGSPAQLAVNVSPTDCSGTITAGGTAQTLIAAQTTLHGFTLANIDASAGSGEPLNFSFTTTAAASTAGSYPLSAPTATTFAGLSSWTSPPGFGTNHAVSIIGATTGHKYSCTWW
jgi:hypothetical protein